VTAVETSPAIREPSRSRRQPAREGIIAFVLAAAAATCRPRESDARPPAAETPSPVPTVAAAVSIAEPSRLVGRWLRADAEYVIDVSEAAPDGRLTARYRNPREIHVSRAEWHREEGRLTLLVELRDRGYPGSYHTLSYDPGSDSLTGLYHHLGLNQEFDVAFSRLEASGESPASAP
jgi:hypothetical protein